MSERDDGHADDGGELFLEHHPLQRHPPSSDDTLRAWDAADEYLIRWLAGEVDAGPLLPDPPAFEPDREVTILNDRFGALAVGVAGEPIGHPGFVRVVGDSSLSFDALGWNLKRSGLLSKRISPTPDSSWPHRVRRPEGTRPARIALLKIPKATAHLEDQLIRLGNVLEPDSVVVGAAMTRHVHSSTVRAFERWIGPTVTSHARKKARLIHAVVVPHAMATAPGAGLDPDDPEIRLIGADEERVRPIESWTAYGVRVWSRPAVFSAGGPDQGTAFMIEALRLGGGAPDGHGGVSDGPLAGVRPERIADVGCGYGLLGVAAARAFPDAALHLTDVSFQAIESARETVARNLEPDRVVTFQTTDALTGVPDASLELVLCNPPFHAQGARGDDTAWRMFVDVRRALRPGGRLYVVGNRHLGYHAKLARIFGEAEVVASNPKFVLVEARKD